MEKQQQKENNEVRRGCSEHTVVGGLVLRRGRWAPPSFAGIWCDDRPEPRGQKAHSETKVHLQDSVKLKQAPKDEQSWLHDYLQSWN